MTRSVVTTEESMDSDSSNDIMNSTIMTRLGEGKFVLIAEIGVNYYDIATKEGITVLLGYHRGANQVPVRTL